MQIILPSIDSLSPKVACCYVARCGCKLITMDTHLYQR